MYSLAAQWLLNVVTNIYTLGNFQYAGRFMEQKQVTSRKEVVP